MMQKIKKIEARQGSGAVKVSPKGVTGGTTVRHGRCEVTGLASAGLEDLTSGSKKEKQKRDWAPHNRLVMECYYRSGAPRRGFGRRMLQYWQEMSMFETTENHLMGHARLILENGWLTSVQLEQIKKEVDHEEAPRENTQEKQIDSGSTQVTDVDVIEGVGEVSKEEVRAQETSVEGGLDEVERGINGTDETVEEYSDDMNDELQDSYRGILRRYKDRQVSSDMIFKGVNRGKLLKEVKEVNKVLPFLPTEDITETNTLIAAVACYIGDKLEVKKRTREGAQEPMWIRRMRKKIDELRGAVGTLQWKQKGEIKKREGVWYIEWEYHVKKKGTETVIEEL